MKALDFKKWEVALIVLAAILSLGAFTLYITDSKLLRNYLFGVQDQKARNAIGHISSLDGSLKREILGESEFRVLQTSDTLYAQDTVVTSENGKAVLALDDGSTIELGPKTMVRLQGESTFNLTGVQRTTRVQVVSGQVSGKAASETSRVVIQTAAKEVVLQKTASEVISASVDKPTLPVARPRTSVKASRFGALTSLFEKIGEKAASKPEPPKPAPPKPAPVPSVRPIIAAKPSPSPSPSPSPRPSPKPSPSPSPKPSPSPSPRPSPSPSPSPKPIPAPEADLILLSPPDGSKLTVETGSVTAAKRIKLEWRYTGPFPKPARGSQKIPLEVELKISRVAETGAVTPILQQILKMPGRTAAVIYAAKQPGVYQWELRRPMNFNGLPKKSRFVVLPEYEGIRLLEPESHMSRRSKSDEIRRQQFKLSWKPYPGVTSYHVRITGQGKEPVDTEVKGTSHVVSRIDIADTERTYQVYARTANGFTVRSPADRIAFDFTPPDPVTPADKTVFSESDDLWNGSGVLLTWQKTGVSEGYYLEISQDAAFSSVLVKKQQKDNFFVFKPNPKILNYWWRVRAFAKGKLSRPSRVFYFNVKKSAKPEKKPKEFVPSATQDEVF